MKIRVGIGFDIHRLEPGRELALGGVRIPHGKGLVGHSDGDVLLHAIIDALLGASGLGDIGERFPDSDPRLARIDSRLLLRKTADLIHQAGFAVGNIDSNILAEEPQLSPYFGSMRDRIGEAVGIQSTDVQVKAKTMEGLGAIGAGQAMAAEAVVLLMVD